MAHPASQSDKEDAQVSGSIKIMTRTIALYAMGFAIIIGIVLIVFAAIGADSIGALVGGLAVFGGIVIVLAGVGVVLVHVAATPIVNIESVRLKRQQEANRHEEEMIDKGLWRPQLGYVPLQLPEPQPDMAVSTSGITATQLEEFKPHAYNLLALSIKVMGENSMQIVPSYKAVENDYFKDTTVWSQAVQYLLLNNLAFEKYREGKNGKRKLGTFLRQGTVKQAWQAMR